MVREARKICRVDGSEFCGKQDEGKIVFPFGNDIVNNGNFEQGIMNNSRMDD